MKSKLLRNISLLALLNSFALIVQGFSQSAPLTNARTFPRYAVHDLGTFGGAGSSSSAFDMNNFGWTAGSASYTADGPQHAFIWYGNGPLFDLGTLGGPNSAAGGPNLYGEAAVLSETPDVDPNGEDFCAFGDHIRCRAAIWRNWKLKKLPTLPGGINTNTFGLNNLGQAVGFSETGVKDSTCSTLMPFQVFRYEGVIWNPDGSIRELRPLRDDTVSFAFGINDHGQAVGSSGLCSETALPPGGPNGPHAVLWENNGGPINLGNLGGSESNVGGSINNRGDVSGTSQFTDGTIHSFVWTKTAGMKDIGTLPGAVATIAPCCRTININDEVTGFWFDGNGDVSSFLYRDGELTDLNDLLASNSPWFLLFAESINDSGEIVGQGVIDGELHAFRAVPCDSNHAYLKGCQNAAAETRTTVSRRPVMLPEKVRESVRQRLGRLGSVGH